MTRSTDTAAPGVSPDAAAGLPPRVADRYDIVQLLKQGNGVSTLLAVDATTDTQVVVKLWDATAVDGHSHARFLHETRVLRELSGVGLSALHDAGQTDKHLYLVQRHVPGRTLEQVLHDGPLSVPATLALGTAIASALNTAHGAEVCHRDVKPANIIIGPADNDALGSITLIDFGFARSPWLDDSIRDDLVGTVRYLAPEAAGLLSTRADERSDLYALGVVLYECLVGRPPFDATNVNDLLRQHMSAPIPDLHGAPDAVPSALVAVIQRLLRKDPAERYQSAAAVRADLAQILAAVQGGDPDPAIVIGRHDRRLTLTDPAFVGRDTEVAALTAFATSLRGTGRGLVLLEAESGGGKSRLLTEVAARAAESSVAVLHGQGIALGGQRPFTLLHGVADDLVSLLHGDPKSCAELAARLEDVAPAITRALPALVTLLGEPAEGDSGPEQFGEARSLAGLARLLAAVATESRPVLLLLDDCQWSDALTVRLLADLFGDAQHALPHLGVIAAFRSEEVGAEHPLRAIAASHVMQLGPLPAASVSLLAESMAGPIPADAIDTVVRLADGNPFMAAAVLRGLVESAAIVADSTGWAIDPTRLPDAQTAHRAAAFLVRRLELLDTDALELLSVGAVLGKQFDVRLAAQIAERDADVAAILEDARRRRLLWVASGEGTCTFAHDKIRESLLARLDPDVRRSLHGRAADALIARADAEVGELVFDLAYHLYEAGRPADALPYALASAELARSRYALDVAVAHYRMAADAAGPSDRTTRRRITEGLGDVLMLQGVYGEAREQLAAARALCTDPSQAADLDGKLGALAFKQGDIPTAKENLEGALKLLGRHVPNRFLAPLFLAWELLVQTVHSMLPRLTTARRDPGGHEDDFLAMRLYSRLAYLYWFHSGKVSCGWAHLRGMNLAERYGPSAELGQAWSEHAPVMTMLPWYGRGVRYARRSLAIRRELGDVWGQGQSLNFTGVAQYAASDFTNAQAACVEAIRLLRRTGDQWEVNTAQWNLALCFLRKGELKQALDTARDTYESARAIGDQTAAGIAVSIWARATEGQLPPELPRELLDNGGEDAQTTTELHLADALVKRANGDLTEAATCAERAIRTIRNAGLRQEYIVPVFPWHATILREIAEATPPHAPRLRRRRLRAAAKAARLARRWARSYRNNAAHAYRESAYIASLRGHRRRAAPWLRRSAASAAETGAHFESALTELAAAEISAATSADASAVAVATEAVRALRPQPDRPVEADEDTAAISIFDRFSTMLHVGRALAAATTQAALETAIRESALALLRAEHCHLVPVAAMHGDRLTTQSGEHLGDLSRTLLQRAVDDKVPAVALDSSADSTDSLVLSGIRSALAAPILVHGEVRSCLYVTHRHLGELFGDEEVQLAAFIATLSGAAYEHLLGSETRFRSLVQSSSDVITLVEQDGTVSYQSPAIATVFGFAQDELVGTPISGWVHADDLEGFEHALSSAAQGHPDVRIESRLQHADGTFRFVETAMTNLLDEPTVRALVLNTRDITERKIAVDQLRLVKERDRIARDLHDVVIQRLFALGLRLNSMAKRVPPLSDELLSATDEIDHSIREIRGTIFSLRADEASRSLRERLTSILERASRSLGFTPDAEIDEAVDEGVPDEIQWHVLATVNEALSNVARHAYATAVRVEVWVEDGNITVRVSDNGRGRADGTHESGLRNLRSRAVLAGGTMTLQPPAEGSGLVLTWSAPVDLSA